MIAFLRACRQTESELPYPAIIATNANGGDTALPALRTWILSESHSLLIDAACSAYGYASDITRTHVFDTQNEFANMVADMDATQQSICQKVQPGVPFGELHAFAHQAIAGLLKDWGLVARDADELVETGVSARSFLTGWATFSASRCMKSVVPLQTRPARKFPRPNNFRTFAWFERWKLARY